MSLVPYKKRPRSTSLVLMSPTQSSSTKKQKRTQTKNKNQFSYTLVNKGPFVAPDSYSTKLIYTFSSSIQSSSGARQLYQFRLNDCYDPDYTGTGTQPTGFDELMALYKYFRVSGSSFEVMATNATGNMCDLGIIGTDTATIPGTTLDGFVGNPLAKREIGIFAQRPAHLKLYSSTAKVFGVNPDTVRDDDTYSGSASASPTSDAYWTLAYQSLDRTNTTAVYYVVKIVYYVTFYGRQVLDQS